MVIVQKKTLSVDNSWANHTKNRMENVGVLPFLQISPVKPRGQIHR